MPEADKPDYGEKANGTAYIVPPEDHRRRRRRPKKNRQTRGIGIAVTEAEFDAIRELADKEEVSLRNLVIGRLLGPSQ